MLAPKSRGVFSASVLFDLDFIFITWIFIYTGASGRLFVCHSMTTHGRASY